MTTAQRVLNALTAYVGETGLPMTAANLEVRLKSTDKTIRRRLLELQADGRAVRLGRARWVPATHAKARQGRQRARHGAAG